MTWFFRNGFAGASLQKSEADEFVLAVTASVQEAIKRGFEQAGVTSPSPAGPSTTANADNGATSKASTREHVPFYNEILAKTERPEFDRARERAVTFHDGISSMEYGGSGERPVAPREERRGKTRPEDKPNLYI